MEKLIVDHPGDQKLIPGSRLACWSGMNRKSVSPTSRWHQQWLPLGIPMCQPETGVPTISKLNTVQTSKQQKVALGKTEEANELDAPQRSLYIPAAEEKGIGMSHYDDFDLKYNKRLLKCAL